MYLRVADSYVGKTSGIKIAKNTNYYFILRNWTNLRGYSSLNVTIPKAFNIKRAAGVKSVRLVICVVSDNRFIRLNAGENLHATVYGY